MKFFLLFLLIGAANSIHITCDFNYDWTWAIVGRAYTCTVTAMNFDQSSTHITSYGGEHLPGNSSADVGIVYFPFLNCPSFNLTKVPKGFSNFFPNVEGFLYIQCAINALNGDELEEYENLKLWTFRNTNLTRVPGDFFASNSNLRYVNFDLNQIERVGDGLLDNLQNLEAANFQLNTCINKAASNPSQLQALVEALRVNCPDTPQKCEIGDIEEFVCGLEEEVQSLHEENQNLRDRVGNLEPRTEELESEVETLRKSLEELEAKVDELASRPCEC